MLNDRTARTMTFFKVITVSLLVTSGASLATSAHSADFRISIGSSYQIKNDVQSPNTDMGTRFSLADSVGEGPVAAIRAQVKWQFRERHGIRVLVAPLSYTESIDFDQPVIFEGQTFLPNESLNATYKFNSWRLGYFYSLIQRERFKLDVGGTLKIREAEITLDQGAITSSKENLGFVPLLYLAAHYQLTDQLSIGADLDGLAGGPGYAIDIGLTADFALSNDWALGLDLRVLDGGADIEEVYNFAQFNSASVALSYSF